MNAILCAAQDWSVAIVDVWNRFWFTPTLPHTLALIRIFAGTMMFYTHLVYALDLMSFLGPNSWVTRDLSREIYKTQDSYAAWSYLWYVESPAVLWILHILALIIFVFLIIGMWSRVTSVLACLITLSYCHRLNGSWFGLDQVNAMLAIYLVIGPCGAAYSLDRWLEERKRKSQVTPPRTVSCNIAIRLIQLHLCIIYLFGGITKMRGETWWDGSATWFAVSNLEYQSIDMTWIGHYPFLFAFLTHVTIFWETFYCALVWPRLTRPIVLIIAVGVHGGIALFLGMITFGLAMLIANLAFVSPILVQTSISWVSQNWKRAGQGSERKTQKSAKQ